MLQVDEYQQTGRSGTVEDVVLVPKVSQALFGQLLGEGLVLLRYKEQICQQEAHPAKALLIAQLLIEQETLREQSMGLFELTLFHSDARPFGRALALPPAVAQLLEAGCCLLQPRMSQHKLTPEAAPTCSSMQAHSA